MTLSNRLQLAKVALGNLAELPQPAQSIVIIALLAAVMKAQFALQKIAAVCRT